MKRLATVLTVGILLASSVPAEAAPQAAPCRSAPYRSRVVRVLGTSEELLSATDGAFKALKQGQTAQARATLKAIHDYLPTYFNREGSLMNLTEGCGL
jgi:hypothetical protein